ncbi:PQQ-binding-like beta-propeller repeat protein [uncultured Thomasclavelia sp.]|uniref:outer membrane protein assembly factor BamB family protein n=1 Tax=uncultured Thomasclavelia sp. TaxID=3025759 RepID=UPI0025F2FAE2|nr:PQQ-binding-like beta-propeller repeat protein [uncultured Thomasclavelia sp.]
MKKKILSGVLAVFISLVTITGVNAQSYNWNQFRANGNVIQATTPTTSTTTKLAWLQNFVDQSLYVIYSNPVIDGGYIYIAVDGELIKLDTSGNIIQKANLNANISYNAYIASGDGKIFVALGNGTIQAFDQDSLSSLWISQSQNGQLCSPLTYYNGYLYTGTTLYDDSYNVADGTYFALDTSDDDPNSSLEVKYNSWEYSNQAGGYYWSLATIVNDQYLFFVSSGGTVVSKNLTNEQTTAMNLSGENISIRSGIAYGDGKLYVCSQNGHLYVLSFNDGSFNLEQERLLLDGNAQITGTPTYVDGTLYFGGRNGSSWESPGFIAKLDVATNQITTVETAGYVQASLLVTTGYDDAIYGYYTCNCEPGSLYVFKDTGDSLTTEELYQPESDYQNYNMSSAISDGNKLYFTNDSGTLFALETGETQITVPDNQEDTTSTIDTANNITEDQKVASVKTGDDKITGVLLSLIISGGACLYLKKEMFD